MTDPRTELHVLALARLGLAAKVDDAVAARALESGEPVLDALERCGALRPHQAAAVRQYVERNAVACSCGGVILASPSAPDGACPACGEPFDVEAARAASTTRPAAAPAVREVATGARLGSLELLSVLGRGAAGTVFRARHVDTGRITAVKVLSGGALDEGRRRRFAREVEALRRLDDPAIVKLHDAFPTGRSLAIEMELVGGESLEARIARRGPLPWREAAELVATLARAVEHAHGAGVVHRDLKPANVLVRSSDGTPVIVDFGLARFVDPASTLTRAGSFVGTPIYMAPEAFTGASGPSLDVYGLGAILYHALSGAPPFKPAPLLIVLAQVSTGRCPPLVLKDAPADLEAVRARAMAPSPAERYATAAEVAQDLRRVLAGERPLGAAPRGRARLALAGVALSAAAIVAGAFALGGSPDPEPPARIAAPREKADRKPPGSLEDLYAVASGADLGGDFEAIAAQALESGIFLGGDIARLRALRDARPRSPAASSLFALGALATGDPSLRGEAAKALRRTPPAFGPARRALHALDWVDGVCAALDPGRARSEVPAPGGEEALPALVDTPGLGLAAASIIAPLGTAAVAAWHKGAAADASTENRARDYVTALERCPPAVLSPGLLVLREYLRRDRDRTPGETVADAARAIVVTDPLLAAAGFGEAASRLAEKPGGDKEQALLLCDAAEAALAAFAARADSASFYERSVVARVGYRCAMERGQLAESGASGAGRAAALERALGHYRTALERTEQDPGMPTPWRIQAASRGARLVFELERWDELPAFAACLRAPLPAALRLAAAALAAASAGDRDAARRRLDELDATWGSDRALLEALTPAGVRARVERRAR